MSFTDAVGRWELLGTVTPIFYEWQELPLVTQSKYDLIRLTYYGDTSPRTSTGYIRAKFDTPDFIYSNWVKFYPKSDREMIAVKLPDELLLVAQNVPRVYQVTKYPYLSRRQIPLDPNWSVAVEILEVANIPFAPALPPGNSPNQNLQELISYQTQLLNYLFL
jgi:hypothetical protein